MTDTLRGNDSKSARSSVPESESVSADSLLRDIARAPDATPRGSKLNSAAFSSRAPPVLASGAVIAGRFRLERKLGEGGMGVVWKAAHMVTRKPVALKFLKLAGGDAPASVRRFLREARAACAARHPSVVEVHDVLELEDGSPVMVMELLVGETLAQRLKRGPVLTLAELAQIMVHVGSAVGCAHAAGIVHRDLKPDNIFLTPTASGHVVKVLDFGVAKLTASEGDAEQTGATGTGAILGTPYYMAPEQLFGEKDIDHRADIWALGIIFYEALTGCLPTRADNVGQIYKVVLSKAIVPLHVRAAQLPAPFLAMVDRMLSRDRTKRPANVNAVLSVLAQYTDEKFVVVPEPTASSLRVGADSGEWQRPDDSDLARASTSAELAPLNRSGIEVPLRTSAFPRHRGQIWTLVAVATASALGIGGVLAGRGRTHAPFIVAGTAALPAAGTIAATVARPAGAAATAELAIGATTAGTILRRAATVPVESPSVAVTAAPSSIPRVATAPVLGSSPRHAPISRSETGRPKPTTAASNSSAAPHGSAPLPIQAYVPNTGPGLVDPGSYQ